MSKYTNPDGLMDLMLEGAAALFAFLLILWLCVWVFVHIWMFIIGGLLLAGGIYALVRWRRWRNAGW